MKKGLPGLIKLNQRKVDEGRRKVAELEILADDLRDQIRILQDDINREGAIERHTIEDQRDFSAFLRGALERRDTLQASIVEITSEIAIARDGLAEAFQELKSCEIAQAGREREERRKAASRERAKLDEVGLEMFRRKVATS